jgi:hypothetical protein
MEDAVAKLLLEKRQHASYFHFRGDRVGTETDVVRDWLQATYADPRAIYRQLSGAEDPPDVIATTHSGERHGFEVTEFVDAETVRACEKGQNADLKEYSETELFALIDQRIVEKSGKPLIYSDEPDLCYGSGFSHLAKLCTESPTFFDEVWFMIPEINISGGEPDRPHCQLFRVAPVRRR